MKRLLLFNSVVAAGFLALWSVLVLAEVVLGWRSSLLGWIFFGSMPLAGAGFFLASFQAVTPAATARADLFALLAGLLASVLFLMLGPVLIVNLKLLLGGGL